MTPTETLTLLIPANEWMTSSHAGLNADVSTKTWDNRSGPRSDTNTTWSLTHSLEPKARRG